VSQPHPNVRAVAPGSVIRTALADDARREVVPQARLMELVGVCSRVDGSRFVGAATALTQATSR
jgi:hypothetical protein